MSQYSLLKERIDQEQLILLDGALGTELQRRGISTRLPLWSAQALIDCPEMVRDIHRDYVNAGADILTTNTFRTTGRVLAKAGLEDKTEQLNHLAVTLARQAEEEAGRPIWVAGSIAPLEDCYSPKLAPSFEQALAEHREQARYLKQAGVDFFLLETFNTVHEAQAALQATRETGLPVWVSWVIESSGDLLSGQSLTEAVKVSRQGGADVMLLNCRSLEVLTPALQKLASISQLPIGAYANGDGKPDDDQGWIFNETVGVDHYLDVVSRWIEDNNIRIVGGCCGTTPLYIQRLKQIITKKFS